MNQYGCEVTHEVFEKHIKSSALKKSALSISTETLTQANVKTYPL